MGPTNKPRIILHLGSSKSGSTTLQYFLNSNRDALLAKGVLVPKSASGGINHKGLALYVGANPMWTSFARVQGLPAERPADFEDLFEARLTREIADSNPDVVVLSFEGALRWEPHQIDKLMGLFYRLSDDVQLVAVLRPHDRWAVSSYSTRLLQHGIAYDNPLVNDIGQPHGIQCAEQLGLWGEHVPPENLSVIAFDDHKDILSAYIQCMGLAGHVVPAMQVPRKNVGISAYGQSVILKLNKQREALGIHPNEERQLRTRLKFVLPQGAPLLPSVAEVASHSEAFAQDRAHLKERYIDPGSRFFQDLVTYPDERANIEVTDEELAALKQEAMALSQEEVRVRRGFLPVRQ